MRWTSFFLERQSCEAPPRVSLRSEILRLDRAAEREGEGEPVVTSDHFEEVAAAGILTELRGFEEGSSLLQAVRLQAAMEMLRRSGFNLVLLPIGAVAQMERKFLRRRWWRRSG